MAEIGLVASIFSIAAVGTSVATTLYETADVMMNAHQQIFALAKHVSQFTTVLKHMGQVLKTERTNCSKEVLCDIRKIKHSCERTFKEINSTVESKRFRRFVAVRWLFKRTKALELEARLDSQQSMLQCIIHTLTVSKLGHMDSRSKQDSEHITGLSVEIKLLKTFIMESYNDLAELREAEARNQPMFEGSSHPGVRHACKDGSTYPPNTIGKSNAYEPPIARSPSPTSRASKLEDEHSNSDDGADDDINSTNSKDQNDQDGARPAGNTSNTEGLLSTFSFQPPSVYNGSSDLIMHRESNLFLRMVPYRPRHPNRMRSDCLIPGEQGLDSGTKSATQEATHTVRLLLDKWTTSGSTPVSSILEEEAAREKTEAEQAFKRRDPDFRFDTLKRSPSPGADFDEDDVDRTHYPGLYEYSPHFQDDYMPPAPPWDNIQPQNGDRSSIIPGPRRKDFWKPYHHFPQPPDRQLGVEILAALRSTRGGIYYTKSNEFRQVHYVDQYPIYTCAFVPSSIVPDNDWKPLNTELGRGSIRREALDLLGYSYIETETGSFSISRDLDLKDVEELVSLSYQALNRCSKERSKKVIKERGWDKAIEAMNRMTGMYPNEPSAASQYPAPMPKSGNYKIAPYGGYTGHRPFTEYDNILQDKSAPSRPPLSRPRAREHRQAALTPSPPVEVDRQEHDTTKATRPEVTFALPRAQPTSSTADTAKGAQPSQAKPDDPPSRTDGELQQARQRLDQLRKRKEEAEKSNDVATASDISFFVIPDLEEKIERLLKQQRKEGEKRATPVARNREYNRSHHTEVETDSECSDDEGAR